MKKALSIISIIAGSLMLLSVVAPMIIGAILEAKATGAIGIIGGADGPTAIFVAGKLGAGSIIVEVLIGVLLVGIGIWGIRKIKKQG